MTVMISPDAVLYRARLGAAASARGEHVVCQLLGWTGADDSLAKVRVVRSTVAGMPAGHIGLVKRDRLVIAAPACERRRPTH